MKTLSDSWSEYVAAVYPNGLHPMALVEARKSFHAGALVLFRLISEAKTADERKALFDEAKSECDDIKIGSTLQKSNVIPMIDPYAPCPCGKKNGDGFLMKYKFCCGKPSP